MPADHTTLTVLAVIGLATVIRSAFGFGEALVAVPLLVLIIPVEVAAPLAVLVSGTVAGLVLVRDWREVHAGSVGRLILSTLFGIPFGLLLLISVAEPVIKAILAVVIITFSAYRLVGRSRWELEDDRLAWLFGLGAGVLGAAYGMNGPPLVVLPATALGRVLNRRLGGPRFLVSVHVGLVVIGAMLLIQAAWGSGRSRP